MNKVITINLNGNAYPLEEDGYEALRAYLDTAARRLEGNPDKAEIIADIEQAIADKFRAILGTNKTVVVTAEVERIVAEMGPVEDASAPEPAPSSAGPGRAAEAADAPPGPSRRLYRIQDGAVIAGVCNGIAAYCGLDVTVVRVLFAALAVLTWGLVGVPLYILLIFILPTAHTSAERAAAHGTPSTAEEFIRRAREGYYEGVKTFHDKRAHRAWKRKFRQEMRTWRHGFRHEMRAHARQWHRQWQNAWAPPPRPNFVAWAFVPVLSVAIWVLGLAALVAVLSLLLTGAVFGVLPPHGVPWWIGIIALVLAFHILAWPLRALRYSCIFHGGAGYGPHVGGGSPVVGLAFVVLVVWLANRHWPEAHQALENLPPLIHHATDSLRDWWSRR